MCLFLFIYKFVLYIIILLQLVPNSYLDFINNSNINDKKLKIINNNLDSFPSSSLNKQINQISSKNLGYYLNHCNNNIFLLHN